VDRKSVTHRLSVNCLFRKKLNCHDKQQGTIFADCKINTEWTNDATPNLHPKCRQTIERFAKRSGRALQAFDSPSKGRDEFPAPTFLGSLALKFTDQFGDCLRKANLKWSFTMPEMGMLFLLSLGCFLLVDCFQFSQKLLRRDHRPNLGVLLQVGSGKLLAINCTNLPETCVLGHFQDRNIQLFFSGHRKLPGKDNTRSPSHILPQQRRVQNHSAKSEARLDWGKRNCWTGSGG
jgi:hypothetical protein